MRLPSDFQQIAMSETTPCESPDHSLLPFHNFRGPRVYDRPLEMFRRLNIRGSGAICENHDYYASQKFSAVPYKLQGPWTVKLDPYNSHGSVTDLVAQIYSTGLIHKNMQDTPVCVTSQHTQYRIPLTCNVSTIYTNTVTTETTKHIYLPCGLVWPPAMLVFTGSCSAAF